MQLLSGMPASSRDRDQTPALLAISLLGSDRLERPHHAPNDIAIAPVQFARAAINKARRFEAARPWLVWERWAVNVPPCGQDRTAAHASNVVALRIPRASMGRKGPKRRDSPVERTGLREIDRNRAGRL